VRRAPPHFCLRDLHAPVAFFLHRHGIAKICAILDGHRHRSEARRMEHRFSALRAHALASVLLLAYAATTAAAVLSLADPASDAPEVRIAPGAVRDAASYRDALAAWRSAEDVNAWIGARFEYDPERAMRLSETQRRQLGSLPIHAPEVFFASPRGVCVDLARFAVETLRVVAPEANARYLMLEFDPATLQGNTLRRHWVATFEREGAHYVFADSKRPGHVAGPYATLEAFVDDYARYRGRKIVAHRATNTYERTTRAAAARSRRDVAPAAP
jgi:hypothetical protein